MGLPTEPCSACTKNPSRSVFHLPQPHVAATREGWKHEENTLAQDILQTSSHLCLKDPSGWGMLQCSSPLGIFLFFLLFQFLLLFLFLPYFPGIITEGREGVKSQRFSLTPSSLGLAFPILSISVSLGYLCIRERWSEPLWLSWPLISLKADCDSRAETFLIWEDEQEGAMCL